MTNIYRLALQVQDASNISGVIHSLHNEVLPAIRLEAAFIEQGNSYMEKHPALILFLDKIVSLTRIGWLHDEDMAISKAYDDCKLYAEGIEAVEAKHRAEGYALEDRVGTRERDSILAQRQADRQAGRATD